MEKRNTMPSSDRIEFHPEHCVGCECCELACSAAHFGVYSNKLSAIRINVNYRLMKREAYICRQCASASCVDACKVGAIKFDEKTGARYIDKELCVNCGLCIKACPFTEVNEDFPLIKKAAVDGEKYIVKCDLCQGREAGPACIEICPRDALTVFKGKKGGSRNDR